MQSNKRYAFDLTRPLHRYVWQMGGLLGKVCLILDSLGVVALGLAGAGLLTMTFAETDHILALGLRWGIVALCAAVILFGLARVVDFVGKYVNGEDPRSLVLKQRQLRATDLAGSELAEHSLDAVWKKKTQPPSNVQPLHPSSSEEQNQQLEKDRTGTTDARY